MKFIIISVLLLFFQSTYSQILNSNSKKLKDSYEELIKNPKSKEIQQKYITNFPHKKFDFIETFCPTNFGQLYNKSYDYLCKLDTLSYMYPDKVCDIYINVGKELKWDADAISQFQYITIKFAIRQTKLFSKKIKLLKENELNGLIKFLADVEYYSNYPEYQEFINNLNKNSEKNLAKKFIKAKEERERTKK